MHKSVREWLHLARDSPLTILQTTGKTKSLSEIREAQSSMGNKECKGEDKRVTAPPKPPGKEGHEATREQDASCGFSSRIYLGWNCHNHMTNTKMCALNTKIFF